MQPGHYRHPLETQSLMNLRSIKWLEKLSKVLVAEDLESDFLLLNLADNVLLREQEFPDLHRFLARACDALGVSQRPRLFLDTNPVPHTMSIGEERPMIILSSGLLELLAPEELEAALAHEVGHLACGHAYYRLLAENFGGLGQLSAIVPGLGIASFAMKVPLYDWYRKSELTADRAAFLVVKDMAPITQMIARIAGGSRGLSGRISSDALMAQADEIASMTTEMKTGTLRQKAAYLFSNIVMQGMFRTQPWPSIRLRELKSFVESDQARDLLAGKEPPPEPVPDAGPSPSEGGLAQTLTRMGRSIRLWSGERDEDESGPGRT